jgi:hypothetical protein
LLLLINGGGCIVCLTIGAGIVGITGCVGINVLCCCGIELL